MQSLKYKSIKRLNAYNLQEILVVLVIIGILLLLAMPSLMKYITKAKSTEAKIGLIRLHNDQTTYRYMYSKFTMDLSETDFETDKTTLEGGKARYIYDMINASNSTFKARATAIEDFDGDGIFNVWEIDENGVPKETVKD